MTKLLKTKLKKIPKQPGCYLFKNAGGKVIYIGKAKSLAKRVPSYFRSKNQDAKTKDLVKQINDVEFIITDNEVEALLLEAGLIRQHKPKYNIELKDSVCYAYIKVTTELFPRLVVTRVIKKGDQVFGPYTSGSARQNAIRLANQLFKLRVGGKVKKVGELYHYHSSSVPFVQKMSEVDYQNNLAKAILLLKGDTKVLVKNLAVEMKKFSTQKKYELAKLRRDQINALENLAIRQKVQLQKRYNQDVINYLEIVNKIVVQLFNINKGIISGRKEFKLQKLPGRSVVEEVAEFIKQFYYSNDIPQEIIVPVKFADAEVINKYLSKLSGSKVVLFVPQKGDKLKLLKMVKKNIEVNLTAGDSSLLELQNKLNLPKLPRIIECFDISNLGPTGVVGSMVHFKDAKPDKNNYRKFKVKTVRGQSDFDAMKEVVFRRYYKITKEKSKMPDLVMVDGGKPQLSAAKQSLRELGLQDVPLIALAKKNEEIYTLYSKFPLRLSKKADSLKLLQRIRDEAHRFAINYQKIVRHKKDF
ncbi:MAG: excinuclease ABC subunit C [Parcubacteria group bacterium]|nr:excinuclease ABC subunit C [Parcubacteria group bacterium]|tara:strand:- start:8210 stop:9793 length:1584 start_codon:yes stop_codon:yes gene_type:complete